MNAHHITSSIRSTSPTTCDPMAPLDDFRSLGVQVYSTYKDIPFEIHTLADFFRGSYGIVYLATPKGRVNNQAKYAIKQITLLSNRDRLAVAQEIKILQQIRHENVLKLESAFIIDDPSHGMLNSICLVTTPWAPWSLDRFIRELCQNSGLLPKCPWFQPQALDPWPSIVRQCLSGLKYLHDHQPRPIRHKDIKPHNILLSFDPESSWPEVRPIIIDFGISKEHIDGDTTANTGTYEYKAPEQIKKQDPTLASDIFSLGCCFTLIEGILHPWPSLQVVYNKAMGEGACQFAENTNRVNSFLDLLTKPSDLEHSPLEYFRNHFRVLVQQMLEVEPTDRSSAAAALEITENLEVLLLRQKRYGLQTSPRMMDWLLYNKIAFWLGSISHGYIPTATEETQEVAGKILPLPRRSIRFSKGGVMMPDLSYCCEHCYGPNLVVEMISSRKMKFLADTARRYIEGTKGQIRTVVGLRFKDFYPGGRQVAFSVWKAEYKGGEWITTTQVDNKVSLFLCFRTFEWPISSHKPRN